MTNVRNLRNCFRKSQMQKDCPPASIPDTAICAQRKKPGARRKQMKVPYSISRRGRCIARHSNDRYIALILSADLYSDDRHLLPVISDDRREEESQRIRS